MWNSTKPAMAAVVATFSALASLHVPADVVYREFNKSTVTTDSRGVPRKITPDYVAVVEPFIVTVNMADLPALSPWKPGDPIVTIPKRRGEPRIRDPRPVNPTAGIDPLLAKQQAAEINRGVAGFTTPLLNFEADRSGANPHDPNGEIGPDYFAFAINSGGGSRITFYNKADGTQADQFTLDILGEGACTDGLGDPIVLYDEMAGRWLLTEFSGSGNVMCVYVSQTGDPLAGTWHGYAFPDVVFPDYPKYAVWHDAYYVGTNDATSGSSPVFAFERDAMLAGDLATMQRFTIADPGAFGFAMIPPVDHDGEMAPPPGAPGIFIRHYDDEAHDPGSNDPDVDFLQIWEFVVDWVTPANSSFTGPINIEIADIDSHLCGFTSFFCFPQPDTATTLDPLREVVMNMPKYRNFGTHEVIVGNLTTDVDGTDHGGVRWFELRRGMVRGAPAPWTLFQEGTYAPDIADGEGAVEHRWMAGSAVDSSGNIAIGFDLSNDTNIYPSMTYEGRLATDPLDTLTAGETTIVAGTASQTSSNRWGDYSSMSVDPEDGCTFWFASNYGSTASAPTASNRIASFRFDSCGEPTFSMNADINELLACVEGGADPLDEVTLSIGSINDFSNTVTLAFNPALPAGFIGSINPTMVTPAIPANTSAVNLTAQAGAAPGDYTATVEGTAADTDPRTVEIDINVADTAPAAPTLLTPADGAMNVDPRPTFSWTASPQAGSYELQVATDAGFTNVILQETVSGTAFMPDGDLLTDTQLFWRVTPSNQCGVGTTSATFSFRTQPAPGECAEGSQAVVYFQDDMEGGANGWTHTGAAGDPPPPFPDTWVLNDSDANSPTMSWHADDIGEVSDQRLVSPQIAVPDGVSALTLQFWTRFDIEENQGDPPNCYDGAILEYSTNGGANWTQVDKGMLDTLPYTGTVNLNFDNPLAGLPAWCNTQGWIKSVVDLGGLEGENLNFRFRLGTDDIFAVGPWHIDDVVVQSCEPEGPGEYEFEDGFEDP